MSLFSPDFVPLWARSRRWRVFADQLTRYYTNRAGRNAWTLTLLSPSSPVTACASPALRRISLNPDFLAANGPLTLDRTPSPTPARLVEANLRAYLAHEAGHVRFSCARPGDTRLGTLWNRIEDERIERKMARSHPGLAEMFTTVGDIHLQDAVNGGPLADVDLPMWCLLWRWGHDHPLFNDRPSDPRWTQVRPLLESGWDADTSEDVIDVARAILALLDLPEDEADEDTSSSASGGGSEDREEQPRSGKPAPPEPGEDGSPDETGQDGTDQAPQEGGPDGQEPETKEGPGNQGEENLENGHGDASGEPDGEEEASRLGSEDEATGSAGPPVAPDSLDEPDPSGPGADEASGVNENPQLTARASNPELRVISHEAFARMLVPLISAQDRAGMEVSDRSRGRFSYPRYLVGEDRQFRRRTLPTRQRPVLLTVLADTSGSTSDPWCGQQCIQGISQATLAFARAGLLAQQAAEVYTFDTQTHVVAGRNLSPRLAFQHTLEHDFVPGGGTRLAPALERALTRPVQDARHLIVIISDGQLLQSDRLNCQALLLRSGGHRSPELAFLPLLVNTSERALSDWRTLFPQARPADSPSALMNLARSVLNSLQQGRWKEG